MNKYAPAETRAAAFEYFKDKADKALKNNKLDEFNEMLGLLLGRFTVAADNSIKDAEEKNEIMEYLVSVGTPAIETIKNFINKSHVVAYPIEVLFRLLNKEAVLDFLEGTITTETTLFDDALVEKRIEVLKHFAGETHPNMLSKTLTYLNDPDDRLVIAAIRFIQEYIFDKSDDLGPVQDLMINKYLDPETSMRIKIELLNVFINKEWKVAGHKKQFEELLPEGYFINAQGYLRVINNAVKAREN